MELLEKHCSSGVLFPLTYNRIISYFGVLQQKLAAQYENGTLIEVKNNFDHQNTASNFLKEKPSLLIQKRRNITQVKPMWFYGKANEPSNLIVNGDKRTVYKKVECYSMSTSSARSRLALSG